MAIDEARRHHVALGVQRLAAALANASDRDDASVPHADVRPEPGQTGAIDHRSVLDHEVVRHGVVLPGVVTVSYPSQGGSANRVVDVVPAFPTAGQRVGADGVQTTLTSVASRAAAVSGAGRVAVVPGDAEGTGVSWITTSAPGSSWPSVSRSVPR